MFKQLRNRKGQGLVEYALIVGGVAITTAVAIAVFGLKVSEMIGTYAVIIPGTTNNVNNDVQVGSILELNNNAGTIGLDATEIEARAGTSRLNNTVDPATGNLEDFIVQNELD